MRAPLSLLTQRPVASASPVRITPKLTPAEMRDLTYTRADGPRGFGSQLAPWQGGAR